jgi:hypothetical protein
MLGCTILGREEKAVIAITLWAIMFLRKTHSRFVWITPRTFCIAGRRWEQASL